MQGASAQQGKIILAALDSNHFAKLPKPKKWREKGNILRNRAFRSRYYLGSKIAHILGWKDRHVHGFLEAVRDTLRLEMWPDHGEEQGDMTTKYFCDIEEKRRPHIDAAMEQYAMAKGGETQTNDAQVSSEEVYIKDTNDHTSHIYKKMDREKETNVLTLWMFEHFDSDQIFKFVGVNFRSASNVRFYVLHAPIIQKYTYPIYEYVQTTLT